MGGQVAVAMGARRIAVVGLMGAGKTTLARRLSRLLDVPHVELDALFWQPGWQEPPARAFLAAVEERAGEPAWVMDGDYFTRTGGLVLDRAELIVWLDYALPVLLWRVVRRTVGRVLTGRVLWNGNREDLRALVGGDSTVAWLLRGYRRRRAHYAALWQAPGRAGRAVRLATPGECEAWLRDLALARGNEKAPSAWEGA